MNPYNFRLRPPGEWDAPPGTFDDKDSWEEDARDVVWRRVRGWCGDDSYQRYFQSEIAKLQSPIEHLMFQALSAEVVPMMAERSACDFEFVLTAQCQVSEYVVDFMLRASAKAGSRAASIHCVVECDGNTWHSNREQQLRDRTRDRHLSSLGLLVLRFTSDEIFDHPVACAGEVSNSVRDLLLNKVLRKPNDPALWEIANERLAGDANRGLKR